MKSGLRQTGYMYDGVPVDRSSSTGRDADCTLVNGNLSCDITQNGFQTTTDYILGAGGETMTEMGLDSTGALAAERNYVYAGSQTIATYGPALVQRLGAAAYLPAYRLAGDAARDHGLHRGGGFHLRQPALRRRTLLPGSPADPTPLHRQRTGRRIRKRLLRGKVLCIVNGQNVIA